MPRKKGSLNRITSEMKEFLTDILKNEQPHIKAALMELYHSNKASYLTIITKLLPFIIPKAMDPPEHEIDKVISPPSWFGLPFQTTDTETNTNEPLNTNENENENV
jgi:hypothetical protein